jgi:hypothetical protein
VDWLGASNPEAPGAGAPTGSSIRSERLEKVKDLGGVALGRGLLPDFSHLSVWADEAGTADNPQKILSEKTFHAAGPVGLNGLEFRVAQEREVQLVLGAEFDHGVRRIRRTAEHDGVELFELCLGVTKLGRFGGSTGRESLGKEIKQNEFAAEIGKRRLRAVVGCQAEVRSFVAFF